MKASEGTTVYWKRHVEAFQKSGMSRVAYCEQNELKVYRLDYWRHRFPDLTRKGADRGPTWIPVEVKEDAGRETGESINLKIGRVEIEIRRGFDRELLAEILGVVGPAC